MTTLAVIRAVVWFIAIHDLAAAVHTGEMGTCGRTVVGIDSATVVQISKFLYARTIFADCVPLIWDAGGGIVARVEASAGHKGAGVVDAVEMAAFAVAGEDRKSVV